MTELYDPGVECCEVPAVHNDLVSEVRAKLPEENSMQDDGDVFPEPVKDEDSGNED